MGSRRAAVGGAQELPAARPQDDRAIQDLTEPGTAIDARQRSAPSATGLAKAAPPRTNGTGQPHGQRPGRGVATGVATVRDGLGRDSTPDQPTPTTAD